MIKAITAYRLADDTTRAVFSSEMILKNAITENAVEPGKTEWARAGFSKPKEFGSEVVFFGAAGAKLINVQVRERVLPGKVIKTELAKRAASLAERQGYPVSRKII